jgi:hypothetical protein
MSVEYLATFSPSMWPPWRRWGWPCWAAVGFGGPHNEPAAGGFVFALVQIGYIFFVHNLPVLLGIQVVRGFGFTTLYLLYGGLASGAGACFLALRHRGMRARQLPVPEANA